MRLSSIGWGESMKEHILLVAVFALMLCVIPFAALAVGIRVQYEKTGYSSTAQTAAVRTAVSVSGSAQTSSFRLYLRKSKEVVTLSADDYVRGVVAAEMPAEYPIEALKAQAAAAFTYAAEQRAYHRAHPQTAAAIGGADLSDDPAHYQAYLSEEEAKSRFGASFQAQWQRISEAVAAVHGTALTRSGRLIEALYFSCSAGKTESSQSIWGDCVPYLIEVNSSWDASAPDYKSVVSVSQASFQKKAATAYHGAALDGDPSGWLTVLSRSDAGSVLTAKVGGKTVSGESLQALFGLRSAHFDVRYANGQFVFTVLGDGHGVGLSQYGAGVLARQGKDWEAIVQYYYTGIEITPYPW